MTSGPLEVVDHAFAVALASTVLRFSQARLDHSAWEGRRVCYRTDGESFMQLKCGVMYVGVHGVGGSSWTVRTLGWIGKGNRAFILTF